jgi:diguanylate cyclase (GGDEF)-like protein
MGTATKGLSAPAEPEIGEARRPAVTAQDEDQPLADSRPLPSHLTCYLPISLAILVFAACLLFTFDRIRQHHGMELLIGDPTTWAAVEVGFALRQLNQAADPAFRGESELDPAALVASAEALRGPLTRLVERTRGSNEAIARAAEEIEGLLGEIDHLAIDLAVLAGNDSQTRHRIRRTLARFEPPLQRLIQANRARLETLAREQQAERRRLFIEQSLYLIGVLASGGLLIGLVWRESRRTAGLLLEARTARAHMEHLARHDPLTAIPNRWLLEDRLEQALRRAQREGELVALHYLDLDGFKSINDRLGHAVGDQVLIAVAQRIAGCLRASDTVARLGGDEFAVVQTAPSEPAGALRLGQRLLADFRTPIILADRTVAIGISIGIALYPLHGTTAGALHRAADLALYRAKAAGRGTVILPQPDAERADP